MGLVSVIVTCYNHEKYIEQCLKSVLSQTYPEIELLVINDGSTDKSEEIILKTLELSNTKYEYIYQENSGVCVTRNRGLDWIKGKYVLFIDSDNYLDPEFIEKLVSLAESEEVDIVYTDLINASSKELFMKARPFELQAYLTNNFIDNCSLIRASIIKDVRYDLNLNRKKLVDYDFIMNLILVNKAKPKKCEEAKLNYRVLANSISRTGEHSSDKFYYEVYFYILRKHIEDYPNEILNAVSHNTMILENRLSNLTKHLTELTEHVKNQDHEIIVKNDENKLLELDKQNLLVERKELGEHFSYEIEKYEKEQFTMKQIIATLENEKNEIRNSNSYKLGNLFIKPIHYGYRFIKNPALALKVWSKLKENTRKYSTKVVKPSTLLMRIKRSVERKNNNYVAPSRILIFVIYEDKEKLQEYKLLFLKAFKALCTDLLIIVNGDLPSSDIEQLEQLGRVETRENKGYDTAAFRHGILLLGKEKLLEYDELLLVNDTNIGPIGELSSIFKKMADKKLDFWGLTYGEEYNDFTNLNKYGYIPKHLQSYFLVIEKTLLSYSGFYSYWEKMNDTNSRDKAIGMHETVFTKHFSDLGFKHGALTEKNEDSAMYIHPLEMLKEGIPVIKYTALSNYTNEKFIWQGLNRQTEIPSLVKYIEEKTDYPVKIIKEIIEDIKEKDSQKYVLIIDGVENVIPQLTKYRVENKIEQLKNLNFRVKSVGLSELKISDAERASHIIIYRAPYNEMLVNLIQVAKEFNKPVLYDIDDLVIDTKYTDQLSYVKGLSKIEKQNYDAGVTNYGKMLVLCDIAIASTEDLKKELKKYNTKVLLNRNLGSEELIKLSNNAEKLSDASCVHIGYFSGSITHNENFELIMPAILKILASFNNVKLHLAGHIDIPNELKEYSEQIVIHPFVDWRLLPQLVKNVDINLAPLVDTIFNRAKSEIKWLEAGLLKIPTIASNIGSFKDMIIEGETGILVDSSEDWFEKLELLVTNGELRKKIGRNTYNYVVNNCTTIQHNDELTDFLFEEAKNKIND